LEELTHPPPGCRLELAAMTLKSAQFDINGLLGEREPAAMAATRFFPGVMVGLFETMMLPSNGLEALDAAAK
jgi:hypothetical protein